jgi:pimeloyl-ACP methyl ester carboxylesterase
VTAVETRTLDAGGPVFVADFGGPSSHGTTLLVHGLGGSHVNWTSVGARLAKDRRVIAVDLPGFGRSPLDGRSPDIASNRGVLERVADVLSPDAPVTLVGNSMGGLISMMAAAHRPARVDSLVLVDSSLPSATARVDREVVLNFAAFSVPWIGKRLLDWRAAHTTPEESVAETMRLCCAVPSRIGPEVLARHHAMAHFRRTLPWANDAFLVAARSIVKTVVRHVAFRDLLLNVKSPTLVVHGDRDRLVPIEAARAACALRPDWSLAVLEDIGHTPQLEAPDAFVEVVDRWLGSVRRGAAA